MRLADPTKTHKLRPTTANSAALAFGVGVPPRPENLSEKAGYYWDFYADILVPLRLLAPGDLVAFKELCETAATLDRLREAVDVSGEFAEDRFGVRRMTAEARALLETQKLMLHVQRRFGLAPSDRAMMKTQASVTDEADPLLKMFQSRKNA